MAKEHTGEEIVSNIKATGSIDDVAISIRNDIDPFFLQVDNPEDIVKKGLGHAIPSH